MDTYKALIFDLGKVVFDLSFDRVFQFWASKSGKQYEALKSNFRFDELFNEFEKDEIGPAAFRAALSKRLGLTLTNQEFDAGWCDLYLDAYPGIDDLLAKLQQKYRLVALTNTNSIHYGVWPRKYAGTLQYFERVFSSHELKERKPAAAAYQAVLDYLEVQPPQVVFLDDNSENINGARQLEMTTILVTSYGQMVADLQAIGILV